MVCRLFSAKPLTDLILQCQSEHLQQKPFQLEFNYKILYHRNAFASTKWLSLCSGVNALSWIPQTAWYLAGFLLRKSLIAKTGCVFNLTQWPWVMSGQNMTTLIMMTSRHGNVKTHHWIFVRGVPRSQKDSPHKGPVMQKLCCFVDSRNKLFGKQSSRRCLKCNDAHVMSLLQYLGIILFLRIIFGYGYW